MKFTIQPLIEMEQMLCGRCGALYALPVALVAEKRREGGNFYCPNGHSRVFAETENDRLHNKNRSLLEDIGELRTGLRKANRKIKKLQKPKKKKQKGA